MHTNGSIIIQSVAGKILMELRAQPIQHHHCLLVRTSTVLRWIRTLVVIQLVHRSASRLSRIQSSTAPVLLLPFMSNSAVTQASRELFGNLPAGAPEPEVWPLANPVLYTLIWSVAIVAVFAPLSIRKYARTAKG